MGEIIEFSSNANTVQGYLAIPQDKSPKESPGVLVIQEWWGLVDHIKDVCDRFAQEGFVALAPDLYHGTTVSEPDEAAKEMMALKLDETARDLSGAVDELHSRSGSQGVGVIGFCMGGGLALVLSCQRPDLVSAVIPCYGIIPWPEAQPDYSLMSASVQGHFGEFDDFFTPEAALALGEQLRSLGKECEIVIHPGTNHAFFNDARPEVFNRVEADKLWKASLAFFREKLIVPERN